MAIPFPIAFWHRKKYLDEVLQDSPVGFWDLGDAIGTTMRDLSGNSRDGSYSGAVNLSNSGPINGTCATFSNSSVMYGNVVDQSALDLTGSFTIEAWVYRTGSTPERAGIVTKGNVNIPDLAAYHFSIGDSAGRPYGVIGTGSSYSNVYNSTIPTSAWTHLALVFASGSYLRIYINGVQDSNTATSIASILTNNESLRIGTEGDLGASYNFIGSIWGVGIYNQALSQSRIQARYAFKS